MLITIFEPNSKLYCIIATVYPAKKSILELEKKYSKMKISPPKEIFIIAKT